MTTPLDMRPRSVPKPPAKQKRAKTGGIRRAAERAPKIAHVPQKEWKKKAVAVSGKLVCLLADGVCAYCGKQHIVDGEVEPLVPHHILLRKTYPNMAATIRNQRAVNVWCHSKIHHDIAKYNATLEPGLYASLREEAYQSMVTSWQDIYEAVLEQYHAALVARVGKA